TQWLTKPRSWRELADAFSSAADGLHAAHVLGLVHRDFKADNVLVAQDGRVLVCDFGLVAVTAAHGTDATSVAADPAAQVVEPSGLTAEGSIVGTPGYIAPEIGTGRPVDARADQFSFCVALDKALGGQERSAPVWLRQIAQRGRRADAEQRFPDMQAVRQA